MDSLSRKCLEKEVASDAIMKSFFQNLIQLIRNPKVIALLVFGLVVVAGSILFLRYTGYTKADILYLKDVTSDYISQYPLLAYFAVLITGGLPIPLSPVLILAAGIYTNLYGLPTALLLCYSAMALNMIWTYFVSAYPMRSLFESIIHRFATKLPEIPHHHKTKVALVIRITPGIPFFLQNYFLGVSRVPFGKYLIISLSIQAFYTSAFVIGGGAVFQGKAGLALTAVAIFVIFGILVSWIRSRNKITEEDTSAV